jgi:hypothetical protein
MMQVNLWLPFMILPIAWMDAAGGKVVFHGPSSGSVQVVARKGCNIHFPPQLARHVQRYQAPVEPLPFVRLHVVPQREGHFAEVPGVPEYGG